MKIKAELFSQPWLVDEEWFRAFLGTFSTDYGKFDENTAEKQTDVLLSQKIEANKTIGIVPISGPLFSESNFLTEYFNIGTTYPAIQKQIQSFLGDASIDSILLDVDSPGGVVTGVNALAAYIKTAGEKKEINSYVSGMGASAAYWLMSASKNITIDATARVGSIGVVASFWNPKENSIIEIVNSASPNKRPDVSTDAGKKVIVEELDALADVFISVVAKNRDVTVKTVKSNFGKGGCLVGEDAKSAGMVDGVDFFTSYLETQSESAEATWTTWSTGSHTEEDETLNEKETFMDFEMLKKDHPEVFNAVQDDATSALQTQLDEAQVSNTALQAQLDAAEAKNTGLTDRVLNLEKTDTLRTEKDLKSVAANMITASLSKSDISGRMHDKVKNQLSHNQFVKDNVLDKVAFQEAIDTEIKDWEETLAQDAPAILGSGVTPERIKSDEVDSDKVADSLFAHIGG